MGDCKNCKYRTIEEHVFHNEYGFEDFFYRELCTRQQDENGDDLDVTDAYRSHCKLRKDK